jgi:hypothetical protein
MRTPSSGVMPMQKKLGCIFISVWEFCRGFYEVLREFVVFTGCIDTHPWRFCRWQYFYHESRRLVVNLLEISCFMLLQFSMQTSFDMVKFKILYCFVRLRFLKQPACCFCWWHYYIAFLTFVYRRLYDRISVQWRFTYPSKLFGRPLLVLTVNFRCLQIMC